LGKVGIGSGEVLEVLSRALQMIAQAILLGPPDSSQWDSVARLQELRPLAGEIVAALEPFLKDDRILVRQGAAFKILCLTPEHERANTLLHYYWTG
jgi:hypothetical protein